MIDLLKSKTFWTAVVSIHGAVAGAVTGIVSWEAAIAAVVAAIQSINLRSAISKAAKGQQ